MKRLFQLLLTACCYLGATAQPMPAETRQLAPDQGFPLGKFRDAINHWFMTEHPAYARYEAWQVREIADNFVAYQNADGGWPKNIDWLGILDADSVKATMAPHKLVSTLDNENIYSQIEYLSQVYERYGDERHAAAARRAIEYILAQQHRNGGWRGSDVDAITFNDNVMAGVLQTWLDIRQGRSCYDWIDAKLRRRIARSFDRGLALVLKCQYVRDGVKTVWGQQHDHKTLQPVKARSYELPGLTAGESAGVVTLLMAIENPSPEVVEAVRCAIAWFRESQIEGHRIDFVYVPEAEREDPAVSRDRIVVKDPDALPIWARYYELADNRPFFCRRDGTKVYTLAEVNAERRAGYGWYGDWGRWILAHYPEWLTQNGLQ